MQARARTPRQNDSLHGNIVAQTRPRIVGALLIDTDDPYTGQAIGSGVATAAPITSRRLAEDRIFSRNRPAVLDGTLVAYLHRGDNAIGSLCLYDTKPRRWSPPGPQRSC